ncbi:hypothetical protein [Sorangium sp. So ce1000]|uniref:hypothetical protein n=1 Tax=Sorangium sp. So ce1000 TaxID=3133325 RepID=UPI003F6395CA
MPPEILRGATLMGPPPGASAGEGGNSPFNYTNHWVLRLPRLPGADLQEDARGLPQSTGLDEAIGVESRGGQDDGALDESQDGCDHDTASAEAHSIARVAYRGLLLRSDRKLWSGGTSSSRILSSTA